LYKALWQSPLTLDAVTFRLSGARDAAQAKSQLEKTIKESGAVSAVNITVNAKTLDDVLSLK
jgi:transposase-like protein